MKPIPFIVANSKEEFAVKMDELRESGLKIVEITFRTEFTIEALRLAIKKYPVF